MRPSKIFRCFLISFLLLFILVFLLLVFGNFVNTSKSVSYNDFFAMPLKKKDKTELDPEEESRRMKEDIKEPIILWWTPFTGEPGRYRTCGNVKCYFTINRHYRNHPKTKVFMFYGTDMKGEDLPVPRKPHHEWGLLHEESPKNNYLFSFSEIMTLFNHTSTFKRESHFPITTQYVESREWLEGVKYLVPTKLKNEYLKELAPVIYTQSDCGTPSDRDHYVEMLMKHLKVDSYGRCIHNKDLPEHLKYPIEGMEHNDFYQLNAKYKFSIAMENGVCNDYITEKLWRPLMLGSVPIVSGSPRVKDFLPSDHSAIVVEDYDSIEELVKHIKYLNENDAEYDRYLSWKKTGITNKFLIENLRNRNWYVHNEFMADTFNFIEAFECFVCNRIHENIKRAREGKPLLKYEANIDHYGCPAPKQFNSQGKREDLNKDWNYEYNMNKFYAKAIRHHIDNNLSVTGPELPKLALKLKEEELRKI